MASRMKRYLQKKIFHLPKLLFEIAMLFVRSSSKEGCRIKWYAVQLSRNFEKECNRIKRNKCCMEIETGQFGYPHFNVCYLNNMINLMIYALYKGCIPLIRVNSKNKEYVQWEWYFKQFSDIMRVDISGYKRVKCPTLYSDFKPGFKDIFDLDGEDFITWHSLYKKLVVFNSETMNYIENELGNIIKGKTLGIVLRGTDYVTLKPKGHPIQPNVEEVNELADEWMKSKKYEYIYVATEEKKLFEKVRLKFGTEKVLSNNRSYYDDIYYAGNPGVISAVNLYDVNDKYRRGLEYLSSLVILANCDGLLAGNCGATQFALYYAESFDDILIFNRGLYC